ncbi:MAG: VanZ family protein, partial [Deferrisomatales bacterium]|nr:VanZ family protein [Deferrisomatales bacterium]
MHAPPSGPVAAARLPAWTALLAYMALLALLSHQSSLPGVDDWLLRQDKVEHFLAYALLGVLAHRALPGAGLRRLLGAVLLAGLFGVSDELHQALVPGRDPSALDWLADALGSAAGAAAAA